MKVKSVGRDYLFKRNPRIAYLIALEPLEQIQFA